MYTQDQLNYERIAAAIGYLQAHYTEQPDLDEIAAKIHLSPFHFQRLFSEWAGTSPKKFLQYLSVTHAKKLLREQGATLSQTAHETGLSGTGRLHDLFITLEGMSPAEYKHRGKNLHIRYCMAESPFGPLGIASTPKGICYMAFTDNAHTLLADLRSHFPEASLLPGSDPLQEKALRIFQKNPQEWPQIKLHLKGTPFQLSVWAALLRIPMGRLSTYGEIAREIGQPTAARAVGTAIGSNPVAFLIPCHRVIQASGKTGGYMWGPLRKTALIGWESARTEP